MPIILPHGVSHPLPWLGKNRKSANEINGKILFLAGVDRWEIRVNRMAVGFPSNQAFSRYP